MKRLCAFAVCVIFGAAATANAGMLGSGPAGTLIGNGGDNATITWERDSVSIAGVTGVDELIFKIGTITAPVTSIITVTGAGDQGFATTFAAVGASDQIALSSGGSVGTWGANTIAYSVSGLDAPQSIVNATAAETGLTFGRTAASPQTTFGTNIYFPVADTFLTFKGFSEFHGTWDTNNLTNGSILANFYVSSGANVSFVGELGLQGGEMLKGTFTSTPEPGTLALLATGLLGIVAYAWRKRK